MLTRTDTYLTGLIGANIGVTEAAAAEEAAELGLDYAYRTLDIERLGVALGELLARAVDAATTG